MDCCSRMLVAATRQAFEDAALLPLDESARERTGLVVGSCYGNQRETEQFLDRLFSTGLASGPPFIFPNLVLNAPAAYAAIELDVQGPNLTVAEHEASGEAALATGVDLLRAGTADVVCAGGVDEFGSVFLEALAGRRILDLRALPEPSRRRATTARRGLHGRVVPGEGAAMLVLELRSRALARKARVYAELEQTQIRAMPAAPYTLARDADETARRVLSLVGCLPIDGVIGGSDGSTARQALDAAVLRLLAERPPYRVGYAPFKRLTGEWGAAGALGAALAALALERGYLPAIEGESVEKPKRILVVGASRGGVLAPVVLRAWSGDGSPDRN
jgi:3-oxoacyl-[acyl-carrier-protein] synthase II